LLEDWPQPSHPQEHPTALFLKCLINKKTATIIMAITIIV